MKITFQTLMVVAAFMLLLFVAPRAQANACVSTAGGNWSATGTWTACGSTIPTAADSVEIRGGATVTVNVSNGVAASIRVGGSSGGGTGTLVFSAGSQLTVTGALTLGGSTSSRSGTITMTSGGTIVAGSLLNGSSSSKIWTSGIGTVQLTASSTLPSTVFTSFNNLTINAAAGTVALGATTTINGNLTLTAGTLNSNTRSISVKGNWTNNSATTAFTAGTVTATLNGTLAQIIGGTFVSSFNNLTVSNIGNTVSCAVNTNIAGNLTVSSGTLDLGSFTANRTAAGGTLTLSNSAVLKVGGTNTLPSNYSTHVISATSTIEYSGTNQTVVVLNSTQNYGNLTISGSGTKTLAGTVKTASNLTVSAGTLDLGSFTANRNTAGGTITVANSATLKIGGTGTFPTNYSTATLVVASTVEYSGTNQTVTSKLYGNLTLSSSSGAAVKTLPATALSIAGNLTSNLGAGSSVSFTAAANLTVSGNVSIGASTTFNGASFSHGIGGNWSNSGTFTGSTSTLTFTGPSTTISGSGTQNFNNLTVAASSISISSATVTVSGNIVTTGPGSFSQTTGGTLTMSGASKTVSGSGITFYNLTLIGSISTASSFTVAGNLSVGGSLSASAGGITMSGAAKTISGAGTKGFSGLNISGSITTDTSFFVSSSLNVNGSLSATAGTATFTGTSSFSGTANLFAVTINGTSLQLSSNSALGIASTLTITAGTLNATSSIPNTVNFNSSGAQNVNGITYNNLTLSNGNSKSALSGITVNNSLTIATGTTFIAGAYTHSVYQSFNNAGTFTAGSGTIQFLGDQTSSISGATTFNIMTLNKTVLDTTLTLLNNVSVATVNMTSGEISTGSNTFTITTTRTGNGKIIGIIKRNHSFTTGVDYAFESPYNTINFTAISSVTSITMTVREGAVVNFPLGSAANKQYNVAVPSGTYTAKLRLDYEDTELNGIDEATMTMWNYNGSAWVNSGKSANDTTNNYVELSGLTNITGDWALSNFSSSTNVVAWNGSTSTDWNTAANWTIVQGSASRPPSSADIVVLGSSTFTNQPTISTAVSVRNLRFASVQAVTLSLATGGSLTVDDIRGDWTSNATHTINTNNQTITVPGDVPLSDGVAGHAINLNLGAGTVTIAGKLTQSGGANITFSGAGNLKVAKDFTYVNGTFSAGTGTVTYNGTADQSVGAVIYNHLIIDKPAGAAAINSGITVGGNLTVTAGELDNFADTNVTGNVLISSGATTHNLLMLHIGGNWTNNGTYVGTGAHVKFNGSGTQTISASTFNNLIIDKPVGSVAQLTGNVFINGDLTITSGTFDIKTFNCDRIVTGGTITIADAGTYIVGANNAPANFASGSLSIGSTVIANGTGAQVIYGDSFGKLILRNAGAKTLVSPITVNGDLTIESGSNLDLGSATLTLGGNWVNNGTLTASSSTVIAVGTSKNISGANTFNRLTVKGSYTVLNDVTYNGALTVTSTGSMSAGSTIRSTLNGDLTSSGILYTLGTTTYTGNAVQTLRLIDAVQTVAVTVNFNGSVPPVLNSTSAPQFGYLNINNTGGVNPSVGWTVLYAMTVGSGAAFNGGNLTHNFLGAVTNNGTISSNGQLNFIPTSSATIALGAGFSSTGQVVFGGAGALTVTGTNPTFNDVTIANSNAAGLTASSNWTVNNNFTVNSGSIFNAGSYDYTLAGDIDNTGVINPGTSKFILNGSSDQDINTASAFNDLTINKSGGAVTLTYDTTVNGTLNFVSGQIQTGTNLLIQPAGGTITGANQATGWVNGNLQKRIATGATSRTFEVGDAGSYAPVAVAFASVSTAGDLIARVVSGDHVEIDSSNINSAKSVNRNWTLTDEGIGFTTVDVTFTFPSGDIDAGANTAAFLMGNYVGGTWTYPTVGTRTSNSTQGTGLTAFGEFQLGMKLGYAVAPSLGSVQPFAVLAGTTITSTGLTVIYGKVGVSPGTAVTGFPPGVIQNGGIYSGSGSLAGPAQSSAATIYSDLVGQSCITANNLSGKTLGTTTGAITLGPGVYCFDSTAQLTSTLTLDAGGDSSAVFIFQIGTTLTTSTSAQVQLAGGANGNNVFWQVGGSATIGAGTTFRGNTFANSNVTVNTNASTINRYVAINGAVTLDTNLVTVFPANLTVSLTNSVAPSANSIPGTDLVYTVAFTNNGSQAAQTFTLIDPIPAYTDFKLGTASTNFGTTGLSATIAYSNNGGVAYTYTPVSAAGGAPAGYDRTVTHVRWIFTGSLSQSSPNNSGSVTFTTRIR